MKIYQTVHKYPPHIAQFEEKHKDKINELSYRDLGQLLKEDGYLNTYILEPVNKGQNDEVFFTIWNYETLQFKWAKENGLKTRNLEDIKLAQIEELKPDVFYNHSPYYDNDFIQKLKHKKELIKVCWDAIITHHPSYHENYDLRFSLFEPYIKLWRQHGYNTFLLPPAFPTSWENLKQDQKDIDILFYGQYLEYFFSERNKLLKDLVVWSKDQKINFKLHLQYSKKPLLNKTYLSRFSPRLPGAPKMIRDFALPPVYGMDLYQTIARSKIVVNAFTNFNGLFKDNMRNYESIGCGAFLVSEDGIYPNHFIPGEDFYTYRSTSELIEKINNVLSMPDQGLELAMKTKQKLKLYYSKEVQWDTFLHALSSL